MSASDDDRLDEMVGGMRAGHAGFSDAEWQQRLAAFLTSQGMPCTVSAVTQPSAGSSSASIVFTAHATDDPNSPGKRYVARLAPATSFFVRYDLPQQFEIQRYLHRTGLPVPDALWIDAQGEWLGRPGYVMDYVQGMSSTAAYFSAGPLANLDDETRFARLRTMVRLLAEFHTRTNPRDIPSLNAIIDRCRPIEDEIDEWFRMVEYRPELVPLYEPIRRWLYDHAPAYPRPVLSHGDFQCSNTLWSDDRIVAILDFEFARIGTRESDVAWNFNLDEISASFFSGLDIRLPTLQQRADWYEEACGVKLEHLDYHVIKTLFQMACGIVSFARTTEQDLRVEPTPYMDYYNRRLLSLLPEPFDLPLRK